MLWAKLRQLEARCHVRLESKFRHPGGLIWTLTIQPHEGGDAIVVERPDITDAVREGLSRAESSNLIPNQT